TDFATKSLGDVVFIDLPQVGDQLTAGAECGEIESTKSVSSIFAPISGVVTAINQAAIDNPELVNQSPFSAGWLFEVTPSGEVGQLLDAAAYGELVASE
ncbi:MAG: glycine cleavage system protein H, partial [Micrococcales bacterium]|nr:glycine cleavage system protein H [Micrococcales bacterium]